MNTATQTQPRMPLVKMAIEAILGAITGGVVVSLYLNYAEQLRWADVIALIVAMVCLIGAGRIFAESFNPQATAKRLGLDGEGTAREKGELRMQAAVAAAFAVAVIWPPLATLNGQPAPVWSYIVIALSLALQIWSTWRAGRSTDEYARAHMRHLTFGAFVIGQLALLAYACAERLGIAPTLTAWEILMLFTALSIVAPLFNMRAKVV